MNFNMNDSFSVTLTEFGAKKYNDWKNAYLLSGDIPENRIEGDTITRQLWTLFQIFGQDIFLGMAETPFKDNQIRAQDAGIDFDKNSQIAIVWSVEDVQGEDDTLTEEEAMCVLQRMKDRHDCNHGISWNTMSYYIDELYPNGGTA